MKLTQPQIDLIQKIVNARLTKDELKLVTQKAKEIIQKREMKNE